MKTRIITSIIAIIIAYMGFAYIIGDSKEENNFPIMSGNPNGSQAPAKGFSALVFERYQIDPQNVTDADIERVLKWQTKEQ